MIDFERIKAFYKFGRNISLSDIQVLFQAAGQRSYAPGDWILKEGSTLNEVFFIRKGLIRAYKINERGEEITTLLRWESQFLPNTDMILFNQPSSSYVEAIEPTEVLYMDYDKLQTILANNPKLDTNRKYVFQNVMKEALQRIDSFVMLNPEERYIDFLESNPDIVNRVPNKYIANVLGITPVSLSRIRSRITSKKR